MIKPLLIRRYQNADLVDVRNLFISVNRRLAPASLKDQFERYIKHSIAEEIECIPEYYKQKHGSFWIAERDGRLVGMFGLELTESDGYELRRMYVDPEFRRQGFAAQMLDFAEQQSRSDGAKQLFLSTSELQPAALALYRNRGYQQIDEKQADTASNKTIGGGIRRFYFVKEL